MLLLLLMIKENQQINARIYDRKRGKIYGKYITKKIDLLEDDCDMCDQVMFEEKIDKLLNRYEKELKIR